ncbi:MAG TPA: hypothetical protein VHC22_33750 [Pirellulales bacterium]|nr:hypothetical protein [Pirellulales bacterium]
MYTFDATNPSIPIRRRLLRDMLLLAFTQRSSLKIDAAAGTITCLPVDGAPYDCPVPPIVTPDVIANLRILASETGSPADDGKFLIRIPADILVSVSGTATELQVSVAEPEPISMVQAAWTSLREKEPDYEITIGPRRSRLARWFTRLLRVW